MTCNTESKNKRIHTAACQYPRRTSRTFIINRRMSQVIMVRACLPSRCVAKIIQQEPGDSSRRRGRPRKSWRDNIKEWTSQSLSSLLRIADERSRWATTTEQPYVGVPQQRLGVTGVSWLVSCVIKHFFHPSFGQPSFLHQLRLSIRLGVALSKASCCQIRSRIIS